MSVDIINEQTEHQFLWDEEAKKAYYATIARPFRRAAQKLEFANVVGAHLPLASTMLGKAAIVRELVPDRDTAKIVISLQEIDELRTLVGAGEIPRFDGIHDIRSILHKIAIEGSVIYQDEGLPLLATIKTMRALRDFFSKRTRDTTTLWKTAIYLFEDRLVELSLDSVFDENGAVKDSASSELRDIRRDMVTTGERLRTKLASLVKKYAEDDLLQEDLVTQRDGRAVVPVKSEHKRRIAGMIHSVSQTGQTIYIEPAETIDLNNELRSLEFAEMREIERILRILTERLRSSVPALLKSLTAAGHIEAVYAKARYAMFISASSPEVKSFAKPEESIIIMRGARHPFLIAKLGEKNTIPFDIDLDHSRRTLVLTGPNAGGKTVLLKTVGILTLMAHCGLPISAAPDAVIPIVDNLAVDIGDSQSIADDLSTFSSHVSSLRDIVEQANEYSLVLLDEVGSGTAPEEGGALAEAILEHLTKLGAFTIATTHYGRLAAFGETYKGAINGSMEFSDADLKPTYRFRIGIPGSSHAFDIAERYKLSHKIIIAARELAGNKTTRLDDLIESLNQKEQDMIAKRSEAERELGKARMERLEYERLHDDILLQKKKILSKASEEASDLISEANTRIERAIREARESAEEEAQPVAQASRKTEKLTTLRTKQKEELKELGKKVDAHRSEATRSTQTEDLPMEVGAKVKLFTNPGQIGEIVALKGKDAEVVFGSMRMKINSDKLEVVSQKEARKEERATIKQTGTFYDEHFSHRIDLRGEYGDEGVTHVEKYLSDASARNLERVEIIHGMGTGALGRRIQQSLKGNPFIESFRYGEPNEGGAGVTIVEMKK